jgi:hypothetical protein
MYRICKSSCQVIASITAALLDLVHAKSVHSHRSISHDGKTTVRKAT